MTDALTLVKRALAEWRKNRGNQTTYYKCQHFDGWYVQWAYEGFTAAAEKQIRAYPTAQAAANASPMRAGVKSVNDKRIRPGDNLFFRYATPGHVVTAVGWDGDRLLVSDTSNSGDVVIRFTNNLKITHADTLNLPFIGASGQNGTNKPRTGLTAYTMGSATGTPTPPITPGKETPVAAYTRAKNDTRIFEISTGRKFHITANAWKAITAAFAAAGVRTPYSKEVLTKAQVDSIPNG